MDNENFIDILTHAKITSQPEIFEFQNKTKQVFEVLTSKGNKATCVSWNRHNINIGDEIQIKGRLNKSNNYIIIFKDNKKTSNLLIIKRAENETK